MAAEFLSLIFYRVCNPKSEEIAEARAEAERKRFEAELQRLRTISEAEELRLKTELKNVEAKRKWFEEEVNRLRRMLENKSGPEFCLPSDLLVLILSRLDLKDNIRSSAVCKTWGEIASSVRVRDPPCWLMYLDPSRNSYGFFDPVEKKKTKAMTMMDLLPESSSCYIHYSNDGWLLMQERRGDFSRFRLFFFNPFTRERIDLPLFETVFLFQDCFAFSCAPTKKQACVVFGIAKSTVSYRKVQICTWHSGAATWVKDYFPNPFPCDDGLVVDTINVLYSRDDGLFYMSLGNALGVFDPSARTWNLVPVQPILPRFERYSLRWMTEYKGEIFLVDASSSPVVYRLNRSNKSVWEMKQTLDACSIFVSDGSCVMTCGSMSNILYFWNNFINDRRPSPTKYPDYTFKKNRPYKYSLYSRSFCEDPDGYYFEYRPTNRNDGVWIQPPHDTSIFDFPILPADAINTRLFI
ncbi:F-box domain-containing protein [Hirschfeldia incana]|nr:F-box domain-containing protein [Hirschfeldia incana]